MWLIISPAKASPSPRSLLLSFISRHRALLIPGPLLTLALPFLLAAPYSPLCCLIFDLERDLTGLHVQTISKLGPFSLVHPNPRDLCQPWTSVLPHMDSNSGKETQQSAKCKLGSRGPAGNSTSERVGYQTIKHAYRVARMLAQCLWLSLGILFRRLQRPEDYVLANSPLLQNCNLQHSSV